MCARPRRYDAIIVGAGPAGIFAALELTRARKLKVLMLEKGPDIGDRRCVLQTQGARCSKCIPCALLSGWGGAGAFSDGKLTLSAEIGGMLSQYIEPLRLRELIDYVDRVYLRFGAPEKLYGTNDEIFRELQRKCATADMTLVPSRMRHLGTERCVEILKRLREELSKGVDIVTGTEVEELIVENDVAVGVKSAGGMEFTGRYVVVAPGREGAIWFSGEARRLSIALETNPVDIGVRVELPAVVLEPLTEQLYESKLIYYSKTFDDAVRTFCVCPNGQVVSENNDGILTVNGHSYAERKTELTNFALLVSKSFTEPFKEPLAYGRYIASLANLLSGGVLVQRLGDLLAGRRSTEKRILRGMVQPTLTDATPGDLSLVLPYRHLTSILEMLCAMDKVTPGVYSRHTLLYGVEVKFYSSRVSLSDELETRIRNLFAVGDGAGITRGLVQASASGVHAARSILRREGALPEMGGSVGE